MEQPNSHFEGWAVVGLFGHQREIGFAATQYFGTSCLLRIDVPEIPERQYTLERPEWIDGKLAPAGTVVLREAVPGRSRMVGIGAIYDLNPCTEEAARKAIERNQPSKLQIISLAKEPEVGLLPQGSEQDEDEEEEQEALQI